MTTQMQNEIESIPGVDDAPDIPQQPTPEQLEQMAAFQSIIDGVQPIIGGAVESGIDRVYAQKPWSHQDKKKIGEATLGVVTYYMPLEYLGHPVFALALALVAVGAKNADHEEQEARRNPPKEEEEAAEVETPKPKRGRPKKNGTSG